MGDQYRIGADENGLGARLGPLVVTAVMARVDERGERTMRRKLPKRIRADLDDSKRLVSHKSHSLSEAWARALCDSAVSSPEELFHSFSLEGPGKLREPCPDHVTHQCWSAKGEEFQASDEMVERMRKHRAALVERGIEILAIRSSVICTRGLNDRRERGHNRFVADLHAMENLILELRNVASSDVHAICGKVGGIADYPRFFGPLAGRLHMTLEQRRQRSAYRFPGIGEIHFVMDADASDPLVSLASLVGKYVRELLMARISRFYADAEGVNGPVSGYNDPVTARFVSETDLVRRGRKVPDTCFERARDPDA